MELPPTLKNPGSTSASTLVTGSFRKLGFGESFLLTALPDSPQSESKKSTSDSPENLASHASISRQKQQVNEEALEGPCVVLTSYPGSAIIFGSMSFQRVTVLLLARSHFPVHRRRSRFLSTITRYLFLGALGLPAPQATSNSTREWDSLVQLANTHNAELRGAREAHQAAQYQERASYSRFMPELSVSLGGALGNTSSAASVGSGNLAGASGSTTESQTGAIASYSVAGNLYQNLFAGLADLARLESAQSNTRMARLNLQLVRARLTFELRGAYERLLIANANLQTSRNIQVRRQENLHLVQIRFESGRENQGSVLLAKAYLKQADYDVLVAKNAQSQAIAQLAQAVGTDDLTSLNALTKLQPNIGPLDAQSTSRGQNLERPLDTQLQNDPPFQTLARQTLEYMQAIEQESAALAARRSTVSPFLPTLGLSGLLATQGSAQASGGSVTSTQRWSLGLTLGWSLFNGGRDYYALRAAGANLQAAANNLEHAKRLALTRLVQSYTSKVEAQNRHEVDQSFQSAATLRAEIARNKYDNGLLSFEDWDVIENDLIQRQKANLSSLLDWRLAVAAWERNLGKGELQ